MNQITVLLADDQTIIRDGLRALLEINPDIKVVAEAKTGMEAYEQTDEFNRYLKRRYDALRGLYDHQRANAAQIA